MKRLNSILVLLLAFQVGSLHWIALKGVALTSMAVRYSAEEGLAKGLKETFDGKHPCAMCCAIKEARQQEQKQTDSYAAPLREATLLMTRTQEQQGPDFAPLAILGIITDDESVSSRRSDKPPVPPPP